MQNQKGIIFNTAAFQQIQKCNLLEDLTMILSNCKLSAKQLSILGSSLIKLPYLTCIKLDLYQNEFKKHLGNCSNLQSIDIDARSNQLTNIAFRNWQKTLSKLQKLIHIKLELSQNNIQNQTVEYLIESLGQCKELKKVELLLNSILVGQIQLFNFTRSFMSLCQVEYLKLDLCSCNLEVNSCLELSKALSQLQNLKNLSMDLGLNKIDGFAAGHIGEAIGMLSFLKSFNIRFRNNQIKGLQGFSDGISKNQQVETISLDMYCNVIKEKGCLKLSTALPQCTNLRDLSLNLWSNQIGNEGCKNLGDGLSQCLFLKSIDLNLTNNNIQSQGAKFISESISELKELESFDIILMKNTIESKGLAYIGQHLQKIKTLKKLKLDISKNQVKSEVFQFAQGIRELPNLKILQIYIEDNSLSHQEAKDLVQVLENQSIQDFTLEIGTNQISAEGCIAIAEGLKYGTNLKVLTLNLTRNNIQTQGAIALADSLQYLKNLNELNLLISYNTMSKDGPKSILNSLKEVQPQIKKLYFNNYCAADDEITYTEKMNDIYHMKYLIKHS